MDGNNAVDPQRNERLNTKGKNIIIPNLFHKILHIERVVHLSIITEDNGKYRRKENM